MTDPSASAQVGFRAALDLLHSRSLWRIILTAPCVSKRTDAAPRTGTRNTVEIIADGIGLTVIAHGRDDTTPLDWWQVPYGQSQIEYPDFAAHPGRVVDDAWNLVMSTAVAT